MESSLGADCQRAGAKYQARLFRESSRLFPDLTCSLRRVAILGVLEHVLGPVALTLMEHRHDQVAVLSEGASVCIPLPHAYSAFSQGFDSMSHAGFTSITEGRQYHWEESWPGHRLWCRPSEDMVGQCGPHLQSFLRNVAMSSESH